MLTDAAIATWPEARQAIERRAPAVLPFGALEQHGPHLPLSTDTLMASALAERVAHAVGGWLLPAVPLGHTVANDGFPGTVSLSFDTVRAIARDVCQALERAGFPCLIVVNGDYGNRAPLAAAARDVAGTSAWPVLVIDYPGLEGAAAQICETKPAGPGLFHADELETSVVMALGPALVHQELAQAAYPDIPATWGAVPTDLRRLSPTGVFGDPRAATAAKGESLLRVLGDCAVELAQDFLMNSV